ncbi:MAG: DUF6431 domain-containing protein [Ignavibacteriales bacterium]
MQIVWDFGVGIKEYVENFSSIVFPLLLECPVCGAGIPLERHGFYPRNALPCAVEYRISIVRYLCKSCCHTVSLLPSFLLPRFQHTREVILESLRALFSRRRLLPYRQIAYLYRERFLRNVQAIVSALRDAGYHERLPDDENERAIKLVDRLSMLTLPDSPVGNGQFFSRVLTNFMALSL